MTTNSVAYNVHIYCLMALEAKVPNGCHWAKIKVWEGSVLSPSSTTESVSWRDFPSF